MIVILLGMVCVTYYLAKREGMCVVDDGDTLGHLLKGYWMPYISDNGNYHPESNVFTASLAIGALMLCMVAFGVNRTIRHALRQNHATAVYYYKVRYEV